MKTKCVFPQISLEEFQQVWKDLKENKQAPDERWQCMAKVIEAHPEFVPILEGKEATLSEDAPDPFLHLTLHMVVEELLKKNEPAEVNQFYSIQKARGLSHHEIVHMLGAILTAQLWLIFSEKRYDFELYKQMLKEYANYSSDVFWKKIQEEDSA
ncbi:MAG: DUF1841 family protein [Candidatus Desulfofervidaceae bacterium]|nr:DUF1841 family protein [Candidatus Desulfofervidaceae bacterium]MDL1970940.1 DUF1841 family protein [Candidatus Desulfofervidaceae bacterium]